MSEDLFLKNEKAPFVFGMYKLPIDGGSEIDLPFISIQLEEDGQSMMDQLNNNCRMFIKIEPLDNNLFTYIIHGDFLKAGAVFNPQEDLVASAIYFDFLTSFQVPEKLHFLFQRQLAKIGLWAMCIITSVPVYMIINAYSFAILSIFEITSTAASRAKLS